MSGQSSEFAEEAVKKYVNSNLAMFHRVQVSQMIHLRCFTDTDRQKIRACYAIDGNNASTFEFLQRLCCREGWVPVFVEALREQNMGDLANKLESVYHANLLPSPRTPPAPSLPAYGFTYEARPISPPPMPASTAKLPPQDTGDYRTPVQENSHPAEKKFPESTDKGEPVFPSNSDSHSSSDIEAAVRRDGATEYEGLYFEQALPIPSSLKKGPLRPPTTPTSAAGAPVEQNWDGRQHRPVTVKNGRFGNVSRPEDSGRVSPLPAGASGNQPEEDYYSSDSALFPLPVQREVLGLERKVHSLRGDGKQEKPAVVDSHLDKPKKNLPASPRSAEDRTLLFVDPSSPANAAQASFNQTGARPRHTVPSHVSEPPIRLPPSDFNGSSSVELSAGNERDEIKFPVEEKGSWATSTIMSAVAGQSEAGIESRLSAVRDRQRDSNIFHSNLGEDEMPSKPGLLSSEHTLESDRLGSDDAGEPSKLYSGSSERLRMSNSDSILGSASSSSDPILVSNSSSAGRSTTSAVWGRSQESRPLDASLPAEVDPGEEDTSLRSHHVRVEENQSVDLMGAPLDRASSRPSPRASPDSTYGGQPKNKAKGETCPSPPDEKDKREFENSSDNFPLFYAGFVLVALVAAAFALYKKK